MADPRIPCYQCPNYRQKEKGPNPIHSCTENWYALEGYSKADTDSDTLWITSENLTGFWKTTHRKIFSCPYRRGHYLYKVTPLLLSGTALFLSALGNESLRQALGLTKEHVTKVEIVAIPSNTVRYESSVPKTSQTAKAASAPVADTSR